MSRYLNTRGRATLGIGICDRCRRKFPLDQLHEDPNAPGLRVCARDRDVLDPYRLAPPVAEIVTLRFTRPDVRLNRPVGDFNSDFNADFGP
jgi:hypothetical protein